MISNQDSKKNKSVSSNIDTSCGENSIKNLEDYLKFLEQYWKLFAPPQSGQKK